MSAPWLQIVGIGEDGMAGLSSDARNAVENAEIIIGGDRHHLLSGQVQAQRVSWPSPFDALIDQIIGFKGKRLVVLVTGDPLWYSVGARITKSIAPAQIQFHPQLSAFQWAACRLGWSLADIETLTVHGRPVEQIVPSFAPGARILALTRDGDSPAEIAGLLRQAGYGESTLTVLASLGGPQESKIEGNARDWSADVPDFHVLAIDCIADADAVILPRSGLPDRCYEHDGMLTKQALRALAIAKLVPVRGGLLWDIGAGCGSVGIEWMRSAPEARAISIEPHAERREMAARNAKALGAPALRVVDGWAPQKLAELPPPDAIFIGGGLSEATADACFDAIKAHGRIVAHAVTLESESVLAAIHAKHGGELVRLAAQILEPVGRLHGWKPAMPVTQWSWQNGAA